jgi:hypothetical protein
MTGHWQNYTSLETTVSENFSNIIASDFNISSNLTYNATEKSRIGDSGRPGENATMKLALGLLIWTLPVIITVGTAGNSFSFIVLLQREMRQTSTFFYLAILAIADTMVLFMSAFKTWIRLCSGFEMLHISDASCKVFMFLTYCSQHLSAWLIVAVPIKSSEYVQSKARQAHKSWIGDWFLVTEFSFVLDGGTCNRTYLRGKEMCDDAEQSTSLQGNHSLGTPYNLFICSVCLFTVI